MNLQEIMTTQMVQLTPQNTVADAAQLMQKHNIGFVPVCDAQQHLVGIVTDRDIVTRGVAQKMNAQTQKVADIMTKPVVTAESRTDVQEAANMMAYHKIRRLPVVDQGRLMGIVTLGDLATRCSPTENLHVLSAVSEPSIPMNMG